MSHHRPDPPAIKPSVGNIPLFPASVGVLFYRSHTELLNGE